MDSLNKIPLLRFLILFIGGVLFAIYIPLLSYTTSIIACFILIDILIVQFLFRKKLLTYKNRYISGVVLHILSLFSGYTITLLNNEKIYPDHFRKNNHASAYIGYIAEPLDEKENSCKSILRITKIKKNGSWHKVTGNCLVYFSKDSVSSKLRYGDLILFNKKPSEVSRPTNPSQFNYKKWLSYNKVYDQVFILSSQWRLLDHHKGKYIYDLAFSLREKLLHVFKENGIKGQDYAVLSALILGYDYEIDRKTINAYAASGTLHILSVSGLHVGIIYLAFNFLLGFLNRKRETRIFKCIFLILFLWFYALITGLSPPVVRSAVMLTFIVGGEIREKPSDLFNILIASAFFQLCVDPYIIMNIGFQFSYLSVAGIVLLNTRINQWIDPPNWFLSKIWDITSVSLAAQLATAPLGLLYFHQFPSLFILSNLIIIPLSTIIIYAGIILLTISGWTFVAKFLGLLLAALVHFLNSLVFAIENLPYSLWKGISITPIETLLIYAVISSLIAWLIFKKINYSLITVLSLIVLLALQIEKINNERNQKYFAVYNVPKYSAINFIQGNQNILMGDSLLIKNKNLMQYNIYGFWWDCGLNENNVDIADYATSQMPFSNPFFSGKNFFSFSNIRFVRVDSSFVSTNKNEYIFETDYVILSGNLKGKLHNLLHNLKCKKIIIDSSNSIYKAGKWMAEAKELGILCHSVPHQGAFVLDCKRLIHLSL